MALDAQRGAKCCKMEVFRFEHFHRVCVCVCVTYSGGQRLNSMAELCASEMAVWQVGMSEGVFFSPGRIDSLLRYG